MMNRALMKLGFVNGERDRSQGFVKDRDALRAV